MEHDEHYRRLENMMHSAPIVQLIGARARITEGRAEITIPVNRKLFHAAGALHGAVYFLALDNAAFFAVNSLVTDVFVLTKHFELTLLRPISEGVVRSDGRVVSSDDREFRAEAVLCDDQNREIARGSGVFVRGKTALTPEIGYRP